jgi:hypothetical protein
MRLSSTVVKIAAVAGVAGSLLAAGAAFTAGLLVQDGAPAGGGAPPGAPPPPPRRHITARPHDPDGGLVREARRLARWG